IALAVTMAMLSACGQHSPPGEAPPIDVEPAPDHVEPIPEAERPDEPALASQQPESALEYAEIISALKQEIGERETFGTKVFQAGVAIDGYTSAGTAFNEIDIPEHSCVVLGRLLGKSEVVRPLEITYTPDFATRTTENAADLRIM